MRVLLWVLWPALFFATLGVITSTRHLVEVLSAQKAERGTQQWSIDLGPIGDVRVLDTTGVCLYVFTHGGVAAVSKAQLPAGTGCQ